MNILTSERQAFSFILLCYVIVLLKFSGWLLEETNIGSSNNQVSSLIDLPRLPSATLSGACEINLKLKRLVQLLDYQSYGLQYMFRWSFKMISLWKRLKKMLHHFKQIIVIRRNFNTVEKQTFIDCHMHLAAVYIGLSKHRLVLPSFMLMLWLVNDSMCPVYQYKFTFQPQKSCTLIVV